MWHQSARQRLRIQGKEMICLSKRTRKGFTELIAFGLHCTVGRAWISETENVPDEESVLKTLFRQGQHCARGPALL